MFLLQFGFDGTDQWIGRRDALFGILHSNPRAKFVTRALQFGSEPLFDNVAVIHLGLRSSFINSLGCA
jgi:hypothetical protein